MSQDFTNTAAESHANPREGAPLPPGPLLGFVIAIAAVGFIALLTWRASAARSDAGQRVTHTLETIDRLETVLSLTKDAETGQRGFLLTGEDSYLEPFTKAKTQLPGAFSQLKGL